MLTHISMDQFLYLWTELTQARYGKGSYDTHSFEFYALNLMPAGGGSDRGRNKIAARNTLVKVVEEFERRMNCRILLDEMVPQIWKAGLKSGWDHRTLVTVDSK